MISRDRDRPTAGPRTRHAVSADQLILRRPRHGGASDRRYSVPSRRLARRGAGVDGDPPGQHRCPHRDRAAPEDDRGGRPERRRRHVPGWPHCPLTESAEATFVKAWDHQDDSFLLVGQVHVEEPAEAAEAVEVIARSQTEWVRLTERRQNRVGVVGEAAGQAIPVMMLIVEGLEALRDPGFGAGEIREVGLSSIVWCPRRSDARCALTAEADGEFPVLGHHARVAPGDQLTVEPEPDRSCEVPVCLPPLARKFREEHVQSVGESAVRRK